MLQRLLDKIAKRLYAWSIRRLGIQEDLSRYTTVGDYTVARFAKRYCLTDVETAFLLNREFGGLGFSFNFGPGTEHLAEAIMADGDLTLEKLQHRYSHKMLQDIQEKIAPCVQLQPESGPSGRVDYLVATYTAIQETRGNQHKELSS